LSLRGRFVVSISFLPPLNPSLIDRNRKHSARFKELA
jgi:hypothetical protein